VQSLQGQQERRRGGSWFSARSPQVPLNVPEEVYPGYLGLVVREQEGQRVHEQMTWGFPLRLKGMSPTPSPSR
jgi:hypothetical protein